MDLGGWDRRLGEHFGALARDREDIPVFALEHGLAPAEVIALTDAVRAHIRGSPPSAKHSLVWTVYAAEIGYRYAGDEYWQTFEEETPGWTSNGERGWIRDAFVAFQERYSGATPSGPWAEHFSIIAWPITHAILPRDLQQQLARILYDLRHAFSAELFEEPQRLGDFIAARSWSTSARFQNLVQAPALVGQIAAALLLEGKEGFKSLLHPMTLKRIGDDLERGRRGRDWLRGARRAAVERARIRGLTIGRSTMTTSQRREEARAEVERLGIEPRLTLRPIGGPRWEVSLEVPDLSHLLLRFPQVRGALTESRCTVAGAAGRPLARGRCLHGPQFVALSRWPRADEVLLKFERAAPELEYLLRAECMLRPGSSWLFRIASDGLAYESRSMRVRAGARYILVGTEPFTSSSLARPVELTCQGVHGVLLDVPAALTPECERALEQLRVTQARSIEVWPAGLAAITWDGEGHGEWLASETPTLAIRSDHPIDELTITMADGPSLSLPMTDTPPGEPVFVELPPLAVGLHKFSVAARSRSGADPDALLRGKGLQVIGGLDVVMRVREARPWSPGSTAHGPVEVELDPAAPSLEQLWEGSAAVLVRGPAGRQVRCQVRLFARGGEAPSFERQLAPAPLPISSEEWTRLFEAHLKGGEDAARAYDDAYACEVEISADELGVFTARCERAFTPLRWTIRRDPAGYLACLREDVGSGAALIERYSFENPSIAEQLPPLSEQRVPRGGGLYVATLGDHRASIVAPPIVRDLSDLKCAPKVDVLDGRDESIMRLLSLARLWREARLPGELLAGARQRVVIRALTARIAALLGGQRWGRLEEEYTRGDLGLWDLRREVPRRSEGPPLIHPDRIFPQETLKQLAQAPLNERRAAFVAFAAQLQGGPGSGDQRSAVLANGPGLTVARSFQSSTWLAELALRAASAPATVEVWARGHAEEGIKRLRDRPMLARAARFLVLAVEEHRNKAASPAGRGSSGEVFAGWGWSCDA